MKKVFVRKGKMNVNKGDEVMLICGKDKGKVGLVKDVIAKKSLIIVEGVNKFKKAVKVGQNGNNDNYVIFERPLCSSKVKVLKKAKKSFSKKSGGKKVNV